jgi:hypothetical protein
MLPLVALIAYLSTSEVIRNAALKETIAVSVYPLSELHLSATART